MKFFDTITKSIGLMLLFLILLSARALSVGSGGPYDLKAEVEKNGKQSNVNLTWQYDAETDPDYFFVYMSEGYSTDPGDFKEIGKVKYKDDDFEYEVKNLKGNEYSFYVTAATKEKNKYEESDPSNIVDVNLSTEEEYYVKIVSKTFINAQTGEEVKYETETETNAPDDCPVKFELVEGPEGLYLDSETGSMTWTPEKSGNYEVTIKAYLDCNNEIYDKEDIKISVKGNEEELFVKIVSEPKDELEIGETFNYILESETNAIDCKVLYEFVGDVPDGMELIDNSSSTITDEANTSVTWTPETEGTYYIAIKAYLDCDNSVYYIQKFALKVGDDEGDDDDKDNKKKQYLKIVSKPYQFGDVGEDWTYHIEAKTNAPSDCKVLYELSSDAPDGMELVYSSSTMSESEETSATWTPEEPGVYKFWLYASLECNDKVTDKQRIVINVKKKTADDPCAIMNGTVSDEQGNPIPEGNIMAWRVDDKSDNSEFKQVYKTEFKDGTYEFNVSKGTYVIKASAYKFKDEWFENTMGIEHATRIEVECDNEYSTSFTLEADNYFDDEENSATFSGTVTWAEDGSGVKAVVEYIPYKWIEGSDDLKPKLSKYTTTTNDDGTYSIVVDADEKYIAMALPEAGSGFMNQYFENVTDPFEATIIDPSSSTFESIDFALVKSEEYTNGFAGTVLNESAEPLKSKLIAYLAEPVDPDLAKFAYAQITESDETGTYEFLNLLPGKYILLSIPFEKTYVPGYYNDGDLVVHKWKKSVMIEVGDSYLAEPFDLKHKTCKGIKGIAKTKGYIHHNKKGSMKLEGNNPQENEAVTGAIVFAYDSQNEVVNFCISDNNGAYNLDELYNGSYNLLADKTGLDPVESQFDIDYQNNLSVDLDLNMTDATSEAGDNKGPEYLTGINVYPVPASDIVNIDFATSVQVKNIAIFDTRGTKVYTETLNHSIQNHMLNVNRLASGSYIIRIVTDKSITDFALRIIK